VTERIFLSRRGGRAEFDPHFRKGSMVNAMDAHGFVVWLTGLPCSGKSTIAERLGAEIRKRGRRLQVLDGDLVRQHLSQGLGYSRQDRDVNVLRIAFVAGLLAHHGVVVIVAAVSPFESTRAEVRRRVPGFFEVHVDCPLEECERRDVKGMYARARAGKLPEFTGVDSPYERPLNPELRVDTGELDLERTIGTIVYALQARGRLLPV
jgi:adenylylsulfate kinase